MCNPYTKSLTYQFGNSYLRTCTDDDDDNCQFVFNPDQRDSDSDGIGDACDNCPTRPNTNQNEADGDGVRNARQIAEGGQNCRIISINPLIFRCDNNMIGTDTDGDGLVDSTDIDDDNDGISE